MSRRGCKAALIACVLVVGGFLSLPAAAQVSVVQALRRASFHATSHYILGTPDTSGVRLDLESGSLAVREGDDSGYAPLKTGNISVPLNGSISHINEGPNVTFGSGGSVTVMSAFGAKLFLYANDGSNVEMGSSSNPFNVAFADWGTTLSAEGVSMADAAVASLGAAPLGKLVIAIGTDNNICEFELRGSSNAAVEVRDAGTVCSIAAGTATSVNVYWDAGDSRYEIQNLRGGARTVRAVLIGA